jgi:hypothetical protein
MGGGSSHFKPDMRVRISASFKHLLSLLFGILGKKKGEGRGTVYITSNEGTHMLNASRKKKLLTY